MLVLIRFSFILILSLASSAKAGDAYSLFPMVLEGQDGLYRADVISATDGKKRLTVDANCNIIYESNYTSIYKQNETSVSTKTETDLTDVTYTVPANKTFFLTSVIATYDFQTNIYIRLKKQTGGSGNFNMIVKVPIKSNTQEPNIIVIPFNPPLQIGSATDVFKMTYQAAVSKGIVWAGFTGIEK